LGIEAAIGAASIYLSSALCRLDIRDGGLAGAAIFLGIEGDLLALDQPTHSGALKRGGVDENILAAIVRLDKTEAFLVVIELHGSRIHGDILSLIEVHLNPSARDCAPCARVVDVWRV
jgi:hypothetical protein